MFPKRPGCFFFLFSNCVADVPTDDVPVDNAKMNDSPSLQQQPIGTVHCAIIKTTRVATFELMDNPWQVQGNQTLRKSVQIEGAWLTHLFRLEFVYE